MDHGGGLELGQIAPSFLETDGRSAAAAMAEPGSPGPAGLGPSCWGGW